MLLLDHWRGLSLCFFNDLCLFTLKEVKKIKDLRKQQERMEEVKVMDYLKEKAVWSFIPWFFFIVYTFCSFLCFFFLSIVAKVSVQLVKKLLKTYEFLEVSCKSSSTSSIEIYGTLNNTILRNMLLVMSFLGICAL